MDSNQAKQQKTPAEGPSSTTLRRAAELLGVTRKINSKLDVHDQTIVRIPAGALKRLASYGVGLRQDDIANAIGISARTLQRFEGKPKELLTKEQSGRAWKFAEVLAQASEVFGSQEEAEKWLKIPAMALNQRRPVDLLTTIAGTELVEQLLNRLEYGVYT